jgi:hypothetical protein
VPAAIDGLALSAQFTLRVCDLLRQRGVDVGTQQSITCLKAIVLHDVLDEHDLKRIYRLTLINRKQDLWALHLAFEDALVDFLRPPKDSESKCKARDVTGDCVCHDAAFTTSEELWGTKLTRQTALCFTIHGTLITHNTEHHR